MGQGAGLPRTFLQGDGGGGVGVGVGVGVGGAQSVVLVSQGAGLANAAPATPVEIIDTASAMMSRLPNRFIFSPLSLNHRVRNFQHRILRMQRSNL